jgi:hypothetical protein
VQVQNRPYGIRPKTLWIGENQAKGYDAADFKQVFPRYISISEFQALKAELAQRPDPDPKSQPAIPAAA